jgi:lysophospholipase L1-like esterase
VRSKAILERFFFWVVLIAVSASFLIGGLELLLQTGAWLVRATGREAPVAWLADDVRVLCLGDSNTYGLYLKPHESWPAQLEASWNTTVASPRIQVLNLGYPGTNSSRLLNDFNKMLKTFRPDFTIVMVGANDFWTSPVDVAQESEPHDTLLRIAKRHSRLYRLVYMLAHTRDTEDLVVPRVRFRGDGLEHRAEATFGDQTFELGFSRNAEPEWKDSYGAMGGNLEEMVRRARNEETTLVLMTYPAQQVPSFYASANQRIRDVARWTETPLVDLGKAFRSRCADVVCSELLFRDQHPKAAGYRIVAEEVTEKLQELVAKPRRRGSGT